MMTRGQLLRRAAKAVLTEEWSDPLAEKAVREHVRSYMASIYGLPKLPSLSPKKRGARITGFLSAYPTRFVNVLVAAERLGKHLTMSEVIGLTDGLSAFEDCGETVGVKLVPKSNGTPRPTFVPRLRRLALSNVAMDLLPPLLGENEFEYLRRGRGPSRAVERVLRFINEEGRPWLLVFDVKGFFPSIRRDGLPDLFGLPVSFVNNVLFIPEGAKFAFSTPAPDQAARTGLPPGFRPSNLVASAVIRDLLRAYKAPLAAVVHGDNVLIACASKAEAEAIIVALTASFYGHCAGRLELHEVALRHYSRAVEYLGYEIKADPATGKAVAVPRPELMIGFLDRLRLILASNSSGDLDWIALDLALQFKRSFPAWKLPPAKDELSYDALEEVVMEAACEEGLLRAGQPRSAVAWDGDYAELPF